MWECDVSQQEFRTDHLEDLPLSETTFLILLSLGEAPKHGYAIMQEVQSLSHGRVTLSTGTLYGAIKRLLRDGWIRRVERVDEEENGRGRKYYTLTKRGRRVLEAEMNRLRMLVEVAGRKLASGAQSGGD